MKFKSITTAVFFVMLSLCFSCVSTSDSQKTTPKIAKVENIKIDANTEDWKNKGTYFSIISDETGHIDKADFNASLKIGWNTEGLYFLARVTDDVVQGKCKVRKAEDWLEVFISNEPGSDKMVQYIFRDLFIHQSDSIEVGKFDYQLGIPGHKVKDVEVACKAVEKAYVVEIFVPKEHIPSELQPEKPLFVNFSFSDSDGERSRKYPLFITGNTYTNHFALKAFTLCSKTTEIINTEVVRAWLVDKEQVNLQLISNTKPLSNTVSIIDSIEIASGEYHQQDDHYVCEMQFNKSDIRASTIGFNLVSGVNQPLEYYYRETPMIFKKVKPTDGYEATICMFEEMAKVNPPDDNPVIFIGSSTIRLWKSLESDFEGISVLKWGFGGSRTTHALTYFDRLITPYKPKTVVYFSGNNDINIGTSVDEIVDNVRQFIQKVNTDLPGTNVIVLSVKASISRFETMPQVHAINDGLQEMVKEFDMAQYVDVIHTQFLDNGELDTSLFSVDGTHMNLSGYKKWSDVVRPYLMEE